MRYPPRYFIVATLIICPSVAAPISNVGKEKSGHDTGQVVQDAGGAASIASPSLRDNELEGPELESREVKWNPVWEVFGLAFQALNVGASFGSNTAATLLNRPLHPTYKNITNSTNTTTHARDLDEYLLEEVFDDALFVRETEEDEVVEPERRATHIQYNTIWTIGNWLGGAYSFAKHGGKETLVTTAGVVGVIVGDKAKLNSRSIKNVNMGDTTVNERATGSTLNELD